MSAENIIAEIQRLAAENGGAPVGERVFTGSTGLKRSNLWAAGFTSYSDAVIAAGFRKNAPNSAADPQHVLARLIDLVRRIGRFPTKGHIKVERARDGTFPSYEAFVTVSGGAFSNLPEVAREYCRTNQITDVLPLLPRSRGSIEVGSAKARSTVVGYVYLAKHGQHYKVGRSNDTTRRRRELALLLPQELEHVHIIETDDPEGIEAYWHRRFASKHLRGEWFQLAAEDIAAFRRRRYQ